MSRTAGRVTNTKLAAEGYHIGRGEGVIGRESGERSNVGERSRGSGSTQPCLLKENTSSGKRYSFYAYELLKSNIAWGKRPTLRILLPTQMLENTASPKR